MSWALAGVLSDTMHEAGDSLADVAGHDRGPSGVAASPVNETSDNQQAQKLAPESAALALISAT